MYKSISEVLESEPHNSNPTPLTGNQELDNCLKGFYAGELIFITGTTGSATSAFIDKLIIQLSTHKKEILVIENEITAERLKTNILKQVECGDLSEYPIYFNSDIHFLDDIEKSIIEFIKKHLNPLIVISPLQSLFLGKEILDMDREEELIKVIFNLKRVAVKHQIPILIKSYMDAFSGLDYSNSAWINDIKNFGTALEVLDKKLFTHWPAYADKDISPDKMNLLQISVYAGARNNHGNFDLEFDRRSLKVAF